MVHFKHSRCNFLELQTCQFLDISVSQQLKDWGPIVDGLMLTKYWESGPMELGLTPLVCWCLIPDPLIEIHSSEPNNNK